MKKILAAVAMTGTLLMGCTAVGAMDSTTLLNNPDRYRVVSTQPDGVVYVDMDSIKSMQTRDFPNSIENISCTLYVEKYNSTLDAMAFQQNQVIRQINEYTATLHGNKRDNMPTSLPLHFFIIWLCPFLKWTKSPIHLSTLSSPACRS